MTSPDTTDIYREPQDFSVDTLNCLGPLAALAGDWQGHSGHDVKPKADGARSQAYEERINLQPIDPQTNGPQLLYGLRYHTHITKPGQIKTYHEQVGYWLWEPATQSLIHTLTLPRGVIAMAGGSAAADARRFTLQARAGDPCYGICSNPFLERAFRTVEFRITIEVHDDGRWSYEQDTILAIQGQDALFHHRDGNTLQRVACATPNPLARTSPR